MNKQPKLATPDVSNAALPAHSDAKGASKRLRTSLRAGGNNPLYAANAAGNNPLYEAAGTAGTNPLYKA